MFSAVLLPSIRRDVDADLFEYQMVIRTNRPDNLRNLTDELKRIPSVREFRVSATGDGVVR